MSNDVIAERQGTHGDFTDTARCAQRLKAELRAMPNWNALSLRQREVLEMIAVKLARIGCGDPNEPDHWRDVIGYAQLAASV